MSTKITLDTVINSPRLIANGRGAEVTSLGNRIIWEQQSSRFDELLNSMIQEKEAANFFDKEETQEIEAFILGFTEALRLTDQSAQYFTKHATRSDLEELFDDPNIRILDKKATEMKTYYTKTDAINAEIIEPIQAGGVVKDAYAEYDIDSIAEKTIGDYTNGNACIVDTEEFWKIVELHALPTLDTAAI